MERIRVLIVDDDAEILELTRLLLHSAGFEVETAGSSASALDLWRTNLYDVIVLDVMMPEMSGIEACRLIRQVSSVPVILLTARGEEKDILEGFEAGASDYVIKPFRPRELVARTQALVNRNAWSARPMEYRLSYGDLVLNIKTRELYRKGRFISLTRIGSSLLQYFILHAGETITKEDLLRNVWGCAHIAGDYNMVEAAVRRLRAGIEDDPQQPRLIHTVWGAGYRFGGNSLPPQIVSNSSKISTV